MTERHEARMRCINVKVPQPADVRRNAAFPERIELVFDRPLTADEMRALQVLGQGGFPTVALVPEELD